MPSLIVVAGVAAFLYFVLPKFLIWLSLAREPEWKKKIPDRLTDPLGPAPTSWIGGAMQILGEFSKVPGYPLRNLESLAETYGEFVLIRGGVVAPDVLLMSDPAYSIEALSFNYKGRALDPVRILNDNDIFLSDGAYWHRQRKLMNPMFSVTAIKGMYHLMIDELQQLLKHLDQQDLSKSLNINDLLMKVALDVLTSAAFGVNYGALYGANRDAINAMSQLNHEVELRSTNPISHRLNPFASWRLASLRKRVRALARKCLEDRKNNPEALRTKNDLLNMMIKAQDDETGAKMTEEEIISENVIFLVAGHDTVANSMAWVLYRTALDPAWQQKIQREVDNILQGKEFPEYEDLSKMKVLDMVIKESMRMTGVTGGSLRELTHDVQFGEYFVGKGTAVWVHNHLINHNPKVWPDHNTFNPERFSNGKSHYPTFLPFSAGPRNCIGQTFAKVEMRAVLSTLAKYYDWRLDPTKKVVPVFVVTMKPKDGMFMYLTKRQK